MYTRDTARGVVWQPSLSNYLWRSQGFPLHPYWHSDAQWRCSPSDTTATSAALHGAQCPCLLHDTFHKLLRPAWCRYSTGARSNLLEFSPLPLLKQAHKIVSYYLMTYLEIHLQVVSNLVVSHGLSSDFQARSQNCGKRLLTLSRLSVRLSVWNNSAPTERIFMKFHTWVFYENTSRKFKCH
jgi:hypothetical protein